MNKMHGSKKQTSQWLLTGLIIGAVMMNGCDTGQVPPGAILTATPSSKDFNVAGNTDSSGCNVNPDYYQDVVVQFVLSDDQGSPIGDAELVIYADWSANTFGGIPAMQLYDDKNSNGVVDAPAELVSGDEDSAYITRTGQYTGETTVLVRVNLSCGFRGDITAIAGTTQASANISVTETSESQ